MSTATLTPAAKALLASTIRALRTRLLDDLFRQAEGDYRPAVPLAQAKLPEAQARRRALLDAWIDERFRAAHPGKKITPEHQARLLREAIKEVAATWLNRIVLLRHLEALGLSKPLVITGGWSSPGYRQFRQFAPTLSSDPTGGYALLLRLLFDEHAIDLPGLFEEVGLERLFPLPAATLRELIDRLDDKGLVTAWTDDTTLGWVYQYWNDPEREAIDAKIADGGKIESSEIASKTQMFTERYMVEWLLHNSLGTTWLCICEKNGWTADAHRVLPALDARRVDWRAKREAGGVPLDALMPIEGELEEHWKYYVPQPLLPDAIAQAPASIAAVKLLDPACGSGHFLVIAFDLLAAMYREEARHTGKPITERAIAESILANNLHGVDIDPRAVQIAAAGLLLKARQLDREAHPSRLNLVAPTFRLGTLTDGDASVQRLRQALWEECSIPEGAARALFKALAGVDHLGSLLKVNATIDEAIAEAEAFQRSTVQQKLFADEERVRRSTKSTFIGSRETIFDKLERFLDEHASEDDLGLKLAGEQLAQGVRFLRMAREGTYDLVVGNPPYQSTSKMADAKYVAAKYPRGKADLYAAFLERGLELAKDGGLSALLTMRGWMFLGQFKELRKHLLHDSNIGLLGDFDRGAFQEVADEVISVVLTVARRAKPGIDASIAMQPTPLDDRSRDSKRTDRKRAAVLAQVGRYKFDARGFKAVDGEPLVYWWDKALIRQYMSLPKFKDNYRVRFGVRTSDNGRFIRRPWEVSKRDINLTTIDAKFDMELTKFAPIVMGGAGRAWAEPVSFVLEWAHRGLSVCVTLEQVYGAYPQSVDYYFLPMASLPKIGNNPKARITFYRSIVDNAAPSVFGENMPNVLCSLNKSISQYILGSLNPSVNTQPSDILRLPVFEDELSVNIFNRIRDTFQVEEFSREASVDFRRPGPSPWRYAQNWAQQAVDRAEGASLPPYAEELDPPASVAFVSFALGAAMGRFSIDGQGILDHCPDDALPSGILFLSARADEGGKDSLDHPACQGLHAAWSEHGAKVGEGDDLRTYLRKSFFAHVKDTYENRPIYFPLSSKQKSFVAWVSIHRFHERWGDTGTWDDGGTWDGSALSVLLADYLVPERRAIDAELEELRKARATSQGKAKAAADKRFDKLKKLGEELDDFLAKVAQCADKGPPQVDREPARERDVSYRMDLDDGVMVNSAALWPLLDPQWKDPKKWWKELASAQGRKDYDWSHLAARYFPTRVDAKCEQDPSLAVAHGCFWRLHPAKAYAWELRLQDEIRPEFTIDEEGSNQAREAFLEAQKTAAAEIRLKEQQRRERKAAKREDDELPGLEPGDTPGEDDDA